MVAASRGGGSAPRRLSRQHRNGLRPGLPADAVEQGVAERGAADARDAGGSEQERELEQGHGWFPLGVHPRWAGGGGTAIAAFRRGLEQGPCQRRGRRRSPDAAPPASL